MRVEIDDEMCHGHGMCALGVPDLFGIKDEDEEHGYVLIADIPEDRRRDVNQAIASCPERAISITG